MKTKFDFLASRQGTKSHESYSTLFSRALEMEEASGLDLCQFSESELQNFISAMPGIKTGTRLNNLSYLNTYLNWCRSAGIPGVADEIEMHDKQQVLERIETSHFKSPQELDELLSIVFPKDPPRSSRTLCRVFFWMLYAGVPIADTVGITSRDVDLKKMYFQVGDGKKYVFCKEALNDVRDAIDSSSLRNLCALPGSEREWRPRAEGDTILRGFKNAGKVNQFSTIGTRSFSAAYRSGLTQKKPTALTVAYSGTYYRMWLNEQKGWRVDFTEIARVRASEGNRKKGSTCGASNLRISASYIESDYRMWKAAFGLE
jgi:hypothetical protein